MAFARSSRGVVRYPCYVGRYDDESPKEAFGMFRSRARRVWGHAEIFARSDLILDRSRKLVGLQLPAACATRAGGDSGPNFENCDLFHAHSPEVISSGRGLFLAVGDDLDQGLVAGDADHGEGPVLHVGLDGLVGELAADEALDVGQKCCWRSWRPGF